MAEPQLAQKPPEGTVTMTVDDLQKLQATPKKEKKPKGEWIKKTWKKIFKKEEAKAPDGVLTGIIDSQNKNTTNIIKKFTDSLLKDAKPQDVAYIMKELATMRKDPSVTGSQIKKIGNLLLDLRIQKPDAWLELVSMANTGDKEAKIVINEVNDVIKSVQKEFKSSLTPDEFLDWYKLRPESKLQPDETMMIIRKLELGAEKPLEKTAKLFGFDLAKMLPEEKAAMYLELISTYGVSRDHIMKETTQAFAKMVKNLHNGKYPPGFVAIFNDLAISGIKEGKTLEQLMFDALKRDDTVIAIRLEYGDGAAEKYYKYINQFDDIEKFLASKPPEGVPDLFTPNKIKKMVKLLKKDYTVFKGLAQGSADIASFIGRTNEVVAAKYLDLVSPWLKKKLTAGAVKLGKAGKWATIGMGLKAISEWKKGTKASKIKSIKWGVGQLGVAAAWVGLYLAYRYISMKYKGAINDQTVKEVKEITGLDLSKKMLKFYTSEAGISVLRGLITEFPQTIEAKDKNYKVPEKTMLKMLNLQQTKSGKITKGKGKVEYYFNEFYLLETLEDFMGIVQADFKKNGKPKDDVAMKKRVAKLMGGKIKREYIKKGYLIPKSYYLIRNFCVDLNMAPDAEAVEYMEKNPEKFYKFWKGIKDGEIPRSTAALYAEDMANIATYNEKDLVVPKKPIAADSIIDVFDQYAALNQKYLSYFNKLLKDGYNKYPKNMKNLNSFILGESEIVYGSITKLSWTVASAKNVDELKEIAAESRDIENKKGYWVGDKYLASLNPKFISNLELVQFVYGNSSTEGKPAGLLAWMKKNEQRIHKPYALVKYLFAQKEIFELKGANFAKIETTLEASKKDFEKMGLMGAPQEKNLLTPRDFMPRGKYKSYKEGKESGKVVYGGLADVNEEIIKANETFMPILQGRVEGLKNNKVYKKVLGQGYTDKEIMDIVETYFMMNLNLANVAIGTSDEKPMMNLLKSWGLALYADTREPHIISYSSKKPLKKEEADDTKNIKPKILKQNLGKFDNAIIKYVLGPLSKKPKEE